VAVGEKGRIGLSRNEPGRLLLGINDDICTDNEGEFFVTLRLLPAPAAPSSVDRAQGVR